MYAANTRKEYLAQKVASASPVELIVILYDATISFLDGVTELWEQRQLIVAAERIVKAQKCIRELRRSLNMEAGKEISVNLFGLYRFMDRTLTNASLDLDDAAVERVIRMLKELRETWAEVAKRHPVPETLQAPAPAYGASYINAYK